MTTGPLRDARIVLRERPEAVEAGYAKVVGFDKEAICDGTGDVARRIVDAIEGFLDR